MKIMKNLEDAKVHNRFSPFLVIGWKVGINSIIS
jgi:hypothetical protein